jgi:hypothetical protein
VLPEGRLEIVICILVVEAKVNQNDNAEERIIEQVAWLSVVERPREGALCEEIENDESDDDIFPSEKDKEVGKPVVEPPSMMQYQPIEKSKLSKTEITHHSRRVTLLSNNPHTNLRLLNHAYVIPPIANP